ncbi:hypothetical protein VKT23_002394 [Stygiomarasmius scandens]|uniref:DNA replication checkpoint mediator MRC1 domain-containing protein n=1 Tax=Marasmiellus scandens TaxID=2682957 RepID=A0ABR1K4H7_9AGAR
MTEDAVAAHRVMERYQQDVEKDDAELEKLHTRAIQGEIRRNKRNRGVGVDDSDDEDEEDAENRRRRRKMNDRFDRTDIEALKNRPETAAFAQAYNRGLKDEVEDEFAYLNKQSVNPLGDILMGRPKEHEAASDDGEGDDEGGGGEDQDEDSDRPFINRSDILRELKETVKANPDGEHEEFDTNDVSFIERGHEEDEDLVPVKTILGPTKTKITSRRMDIDYDEPRPFMHDDENGQKRMKLWANAESRKTKTTAGFGRGAAAVTGLGRKAPGAGKAGVGSGSRSSASTSGQQRTSSKPLKAASSMLKSVDQKRGDLFAP